jgi:hypothetical protein
MRTALIRLLMISALRLSRVVGRFHGKSRAIMSTSLADLAFGGKDGQDAESVNND